MIAIFIVNTVLFCGLITILIDEIKYNINLDPIMKDMINDQRR